MKSLWLASFLGLYWAIEAQLSSDGCYGEGLFLNSPAGGTAAKGEFFGMDMFYRVYGKNIPTTGPLKSFAISPFSLWNVLTLAYLGSDTNTAAELKNILKLDSKNEAHYGVNLVRNILESYEGTNITIFNKGYFDPSLHARGCSKIHQFEEVNFKDPTGASGKINRDVAKATKNQIKDLFTPRDLARSTFLLLNTIYFKGSWQNKFDKENTRNQQFHDQYGSSIGIDAPMMETFSTFNYADVDGLDAEVVELPYDRSPMSMLLFLPRVMPTEDNLQLTLRKVAFKDLKHDSLKVVLNLLQPNLVRLTMPKFKMEYTMTSEIIQIIKEMGAPSMFAANADFSRFSSEPMRVDKAVHQAIVEVNEEGTIASAATGLIGTRSGTRKHKTVNLNRPFLFMIRDMSQNLTLFTGVYVNPEDMTA